MDVPESNPSIPAERPSWSARHSIKNRARDGLVSILAVFVVVATHFVYPVAVMQFTAGLSLTLVGIGALVMALLSVVLVAVGLTMFILGILDSTSFSRQNISVKSWPWIFAIPSVLGILLLLSSKSWIHLAPQNSVFTQVSSFSPTSASWLVGFVTVLVVVTEFASGAVVDFSSSREREAVRKTAHGGNKKKIGRQTENRILRDDVRPLLDRVEAELRFDWQNPPAIGFEAVGGFNEEKDEIYRRVIHPLKSEKEAYKRFRVSPPTGILLYGPPGTGKTHLARAIAGELGSPYVELSQADLTSKWINESPSKVRRLFEEAESFDSSVIFIDEIDGLVRARDSNGHNEDSKVVSEFLARLAEEATNYLIIAATNRPDQMDSAILRPGRFDEQFEIGVPDAKGREEIFKVQLRGRRPSLSDSDFRVLGERTDGYTAADIASVVERAALNAAERDADNITLDDLTSHFY